MRSVVNSVMAIALCGPTLTNAQIVTTTPLPPVPQMTPFGAEPQPERARPRAVEMAPVRAAIWVPPSNHIAVQAQARFRQPARPVAVVAMRAPLPVPTMTQQAAPVVALPTPMPAPALAPAPIQVRATALAVVAVSPAAPIMGGGIVLPSNTDVLLRLDEEVSSKRKRVGDKFRLTVVQDVMLGGYVVIPRGTPAHGSMSYRTGKGAFGKSAKIEIDMDSISLGERTIPLAGRFRQEGRGNTGATIGTAVAAGLIAAAFVTGRSAVFEMGREFRASTREAVPVVLPEAN